MKVQRDPLYLFLCHLEWAGRRDMAAYKELVGALDDQDLEIRQLAESLLHRSSPRPRHKDRHVSHQAAAARIGGAMKRA